MRNSGFFRSLALMVSIPLLLLGITLLVGCSDSKKEASEKKTKQGTFKMAVLKVDQLSKMGSKTSDGQYLVAQVVLENAGNNSLTFTPSNFSLQNITMREEDRYSQPIEKGMTWAFKDVYGEELSNKVIDYQDFSVYPRMKIERYFVFMVPSNADVYKYQITETSTETSTPLVTAGITKVNDHRNAPENLTTNE